MIHDESRTNSQWLDPRFPGELLQPISAQLLNATAEFPLKLFCLNSCLARNFDDRPSLSRLLNDRDRAAETRLQLVEIPSKPIARGLLSPNIHRVTSVYGLRQTMSDLGFIHRFIPAQDNQSGRVLLLLHGTGGNENDMVPLGRDLDPTAALLSLRGNVLENGLPRFFRRLAEGVFDEEDVIRRANELANFLPKAAAKYEFDMKRLTAVGYSNGANIVAAVLLLRPSAITSAVLLRAMVPLIPASEPDLSGTRVLICSGKRDPIIPVENAERLVAMLRQADSDVTHRFEEAGHQLVFGELEAAKKWLRESASIG